MLNIRGSVSDLMFRTSVGTCTPPFHSCCWCTFCVGEGLGCWSAPLGFSGQVGATRSKLVLASLHGVKSQVPVSPHSGCHCALCVVVVIASGHLDGHLWEDLAFFLGFLRIVEGKCPES